MGSVNKAIIVGNVGKDPDVKHTAGGDTVANFSVATSEQWNSGRDGTRQERTEWHNVVCWRKLAEVAEKYIRKGKQVYVEGKIQTREWEDRDGNKRRTTEIVASSITLLGRKDDGGGAAPREESQPRGGPRMVTPEDPIMDDEIPF